jgi:hypothetical protein
MRQLVGETLYAPEVKITNSSGSPVAIISVELIARGKTYANTHPRPETFPLTIQSGDTEPVHVLFRLDEPIRRTFQQTADLIVAYRCGGKQGTAHVTIIGGRLEGTP